MKKITDKARLDCMENISYYLSIEATPRLIFGHPDERNNKVRWVILGPSMKGYGFSIREAIDDYITKKGLK